MRMAKITGFGGAFIRTANPEALYKWYEQHLGLKLESGTFIFPEAGQRGPVAVSFFKQTSDYFPVTQPAMLNFQVDDLDALLESLLGAGVSVDPRRDEYDFGKFGWITDLDGNRVELWEPR
jgi:predicted enzyme related to lactoylglutathione lyase